MTLTERCQRKCVRDLWKAGRCATRIAQCTGIPMELVVSEIRAHEQRAEQARAIVAKRQRVAVPVLPGEGS